jgi:MerR family mercuric resistance operon transcriptional regulator
VRTYTIGELAAAAGVNVETIRFYERKGLVRQPPRGEGHRRYPETDLERLRQIRRAKDLGFTLAEIASLLDAAAAGSTGDLVAAARARVVAVDAEMAELRARRVRLEQLAGLCADEDADCLTFRVPGARVG